MIVGHEQVAISSSQSAVYNRVYASPCPPPGHRVASNLILRNVVAICAACAATFAADLPAQRPAWRPEKAVELIVTTNPGGANDHIARAMQRILREEKLVPVPLEVMNKAGGNQTIALAYVAQHAADPHYLLIANPTLLGTHI